MEPAKLQGKIIPILAGFGLYLFTVGVSFAGFRYLETPPTVEFQSPIPEGGGLAIDPNEPKTEACPLNGALYTKTEEKVWETRRPLAVMIENHEEARPQSGLTAADVVYEAVAEGGITRFLAMFYCGAVAKDTLLGPIRSARTYYLDWASEYGETPLYVHVGGANLPGPADALGQIQEYGWGGRNGNDLNQFSIGYPTFWRDYDRLGRTVATEHTMYSTTEKLWAGGAKRGWSNKDLDGVDWQQNFVAWNFAAPDVESQGQGAEKASFAFWDGYKEYAVTWQYNPQTRLYERTNGDAPHKDLNNGNRLTASVVIVQLVQEKGPIDDLKHLLYKTIGSGKALVFQNGKVIEATWSKKSHTARTQFITTAGKPLDFTPGKIWIEIVPSGNTVDY